MDRKKPKVITVASIKGGVGKSTSAIIFATLLSKTHKVLLIDMDTQASVTSFFYEKVTDQIIDLRKKNICEVIKNNLDIVESIVYISKNLDLIPSYLTLHTLNGEFYCKNRSNFIELKLSRELKKLKKNYDYILIDTNPSLDFTLTCALCTTDYLIVPMTAEKWTLESYDLLEFFIKELNRLIPIFFIITRFKKNNTHKELLEYLQSRKGFLGLVNEREDLNRKIARNDTFDLTKDYIEEYKKILDSLFMKIKKSDIKKF
ncbi:ParA family protein (plasmid) [Borrelia miyamotoi]|uniref:ParA family protein n=1 Tax=Borrelia miyamotoi TaxID=47466 RepID=A0A481YIW6_9SPIR|nr:ParA family protein [Borrelia miyamotoi]ATQ15547.1 ParA family protein [Borrelia miyamotoi]ATQ17828.2 ParA family protein [Borrelia miyamotoi]ATQ20301.1 ParA family protein [Borrelia miyamotoi]ATQ21530.1 ParA family protein [Borrelia miyamotoi]QBK66457.1 ParA family protein [Borrelia miyamotoi]